MTTSAYIEKQFDKWVVVVDYGLMIKTLGPYRWKLIALFVAWLEANEH